MHVYDLHFNFEEYIEHRELVVSGLERLAAKLGDKRTSRGAAGVVKGSVNLVGGGATVTSLGASAVAANATATAAVTAAATASVAATAAPIILGVGMAMNLGIFAGKWFVDQADEAELSRLRECLQKLEKMDAFIHEKIIDIQKSDYVKERRSNASFGMACLPWNVYQATYSADNIQKEVKEGLDAWKSVQDGNFTPSDQNLVDKAVMDGFEEGTALNKVCDWFPVQGGAAEAYIASGIGIFAVGFGIWDITLGAKEIRNQSDFEKKFSTYVKALRAQCLLIRNYKASFRSKGSKCGRLTYVNGGGKCARQMQVSYRTAENEWVEVDSDSSHVVILPEGAHDVRVRFSVMGGSMACKIDRHAPDQPWAHPRDVEIIKIPRADGVNAVFELKGTYQHSYVHKAWNFGSTTIGRSAWEWCGDENDRKRLLSRAKDLWVGCVHKWSPSDCPLKKCGRLTYVKKGGGCTRLYGKLGSNFDDGNNPGIESIFVQSGTRVDAIGVKYEGGKEVHHGGTGGGKKELLMKPGEYIYQIKVIHSADSGILRLTFITNFGNILGPCGGKGGPLDKTKKELVRAPAGKKLVGFKGCSGKYLDTIGFCWGPISDRTTKVKSYDVVLYILIMISVYVFLPAQSKGSKN